MFTHQVHIIYSCLKKYERVHEGRRYEVEEGIKKDKLSESVNMCTKNSKKHKKKS